MTDGIPGRLPLLLPGGGRIRSAYGPTNDLASFVGHLVARGMDPALIPHDVRGVAALENYIGSVEGEGHGGFYGNNEEETFGIVRDALTGCDVLRLRMHAAIATEFLDVMAVDETGKDAIVRGEEGTVFPRLESLDERLYGLRSSDAEAHATAARVPACYREDVANVLAVPDMYSRSPFSIEGMVWILNHPRLEWHSGPGYWDAVSALARAAPS